MLPTRRTWRLAGEKGLGKRREEEKEGESEEEERGEAGAQRATVELDKNQPWEWPTVKEFARSGPDDLSRLDNRLRCEVSTFKQDWKSLRN
jgi:hypothetical protein